MTELALALVAKWMGVGMHSPYVDDLFRMLGAPPEQVVPVPWGRAQPEAGLRFPSDYREMVDRYGAFQIYEYLTVSAPSRQRPRSDMPEGFPGHAAFSRDEALSVLLPENHTEPSPDGELITGPDQLLRWGGNIGGDTFFWLTEGNPDSWPIAIWYRGGPWVIVRSGLAEFLVKVLTRTSSEADYVLPIQGPENPDWSPGSPVPPLLTCLGGW